MNGRLCERASNGAARRNIILNEPMEGGQLGRACCGTGESSGCEDAIAGQAWVAGPKRARPTHGATDECGVRTVAAARPPQALLRRPPPLPVPHAAACIAYMSVLSLLIRPIAYLGLPAYLLHRLSASSPVARYYVRLSLYISTLGLVSAWGAIASVAMSLAGRRYDVNYVVARTFYAIASRVMGIKISVEGAEHLETRPAVFVGNHQSMLDILYLGRYVDLNLTFRVVRASCITQFSGRCYIGSGSSPCAPPSWPRRSSSGCRSSANS